MSSSTAPAPAGRAAPAKLVVTVIALFGMIAPFAADWNSTHIYNPAWPPHARYHAGQGMTLGLLLGALSLFFLWVRRPYGLAQFQLAATFATLFWVAQSVAPLFPGAAFVDPPTSTPAFNQSELDVVVVVVVTLAYRLERRRLGPRSSSPAPTAPPPPRG